MTLFVKETPGDTYTLFNKGCTMVIPFDNGDIGRDMMTIRIADREGTALSSFSEMMPGADVGIQEEFALNNLPSLDEVKKAQKARHYGKDSSEFFSCVDILAVRVLSNDQDTIRAVYTAKDATYPTLIVSSDEGNWYSHVDPGALIRINYGSVSVVHNVLSKQNVESLFPGWVEKTQITSNKRKAYLQRYKEQYLQSYLKGTLPEANIGIFRAEGLALHYYDSVVEFKTRADAEVALKAVIKDGETDYTVLYKRMVNALSTLGKGLTVNGVRVVLRKETKTNKIGKETTLHYINDKRIACADVQEIVERALCYPDGDATYNMFVSEVAKISLKYHRVCAEGMKLGLYGDHLESMTKLSGEYADKGFPPPATSDGHGSYMSYGRPPVAALNMKVRKRPGKAAELYLLEEWRQIDNFDACMRRLPAIRTKGLRRVRVLTAKSPYLLRESDAVEEILKKYPIPDDLLKLLCTIDAMLVPKDRILFGKVVCNNPPSLVSSREGSIKIPVGALKDTHDILMRFSEECADLFHAEREKIERSRKLLESVIRATKTEEVVQEGGKKVLKVTGTSGAVYRVDPATNRVYTSDGRHICIVKAMNIDIVGYDYLCSLILALQQDKRTAREIYTLEKRIT